jgi:phage terminase Nu1 subunit (DNA packaging protein)
MKNISISELENLTGLHRKTILKRLEKQNIPNENGVYNSEKALSAIYSFETGNLSLYTLNKKQLSEVTGVAYNTVQARIKDAVLIPDEDGHFNAPEAIKAILSTYVPSIDPFAEDDEDDKDNETTTNKIQESIKTQNPHSYETYRTSYMKAKAEREQLQLEKERGTHISAEGIKSQLTATLTVLRTRLLSIPQRVGQIWSKDDDNRTIEMKVKIEVETALNELSRIKL